MWPCAPTNWAATGSPTSVIPHGTDNAGWPVKSKSCVSRNVRARTEYHAEGRAYAPRQPTEWTAGTARELMGADIHLEPIFFVIGTNSADPLVFFQHQLLLKLKLEAFREIRVSQPARLP